MFIFSTPVLIRHPWQLKTLVFLYRFLQHANLLFSAEASKLKNQIELLILPLSYYTLFVAFFHCFFAKKY